MKCCFLAFCVEITSPPLDRIAIRKKYYEVSRQHLMKHSSFSHLTVQGKVQNIKVILSVTQSVRQKHWVLYSTVSYIPQTNFHLCTVDEMQFTLVLRVAKFRLNQKQFSRSFISVWSMVHWNINFTNSYSDVHLIKLFTLRLFCVHIVSVLCLVFCRLSQIEDIISSVKPAKNYLTKVLKTIHDDLLF